MTRVRLDHAPFDHVKHWRDHRWDSNWIERPRLWASAVALSLGSVESVVDPACGDGAVVLTAHRLSPLKRVLFNDISHDTLEHLLQPELDRLEGVVVTVYSDDAVKVLEATQQEFDGIVLTEILEHLESPEHVLDLARGRARWLVASSPIVPAGVVDHTAQHLWSFDMDGYREMLESCGWIPKVWMTAGAENHPYAAGFQVWGCERA